MTAGWLFASIAWIAFIVWHRAGDTPALPLDVRANDPDVQSALQAAVTHHNIKTGLLAFGVPLLAYGLGRLLCRWVGGVSPTITATDHPDGGPSRILLMRHAEKTGDPKDIYSSEAGTKRAERLATFIPQTFGRPDFVFAAARSKRSIRSMDTMRPLAATLGVKFITISRTGISRISSARFFQIRNIAAKPSSSAGTTASCRRSQRCSARRRAAIPTRGRRTPSISFSISATIRNRIVRRSSRKSSSRFDGTAHVNRSRISTSSAWPPARGRRRNSAA